MKALSIRQPFAWWILHGGKRVENRPWKCSHVRGPIWIHASKWWHVTGVVHDFEAAKAMWEKATGKRLVNDADRATLPRLTMGQLREQTGGIVGKATIVGCVSESDSPWFCGPYGIVLDDVVALPRIVPCKGALGFFEVPPDVEIEAMTMLREGASR